MADVDPYADLLEEDPYADLLAAAPQEIAPPAKDKVLPMSTAAATLRALGQTPVGAPAGWLLGKLGAFKQPVRRAGAPDVGYGETIANDAVNMVPAGGVATDLLSGGILNANRSAGAAIPDPVLRTLAKLPVVGAAVPAAGPGAVLTPEAKKELAAMGVDAAEPEAPGLVETYRNARDRRKARTEAGEEQNPLTALGAKAGGVGLTMLAPLPKFTPRGGEAAGVLSRAAAGAKTGGAYGALAGATSGDADLTRGEAGKAAAQTLLGGALGYGLGGALPVLGAFGKAIYNGAVKPTPAAQALAQEGVEGLTLGQMDPKSTIGVLEAANKDVPGFGPALAGAREVAKDSFRVAALNKALPPGMERLPQGTSVAEGMGKLQEGFAKAYGAIDDVPVPTASADSLLMRVTNPLERLKARATTAAADDAAQFVQEQMTLLPPEGTQTTAGMLREMRSAIRDEIRERLASSQKHDAAVARLLKLAEEDLTAGLEKGLPEDAANLLRAADSQYGKFKVLEDAAFKAKDTVSGKGEFSPERLGLSVRDAAKAGGKGSYVAGGGGPLRDLEANAIQSFQEVPPTGLRALLSGGLLGRYVAAPALYLANREGVKPLMLGQAPLQRAIQSRVQDVSPLLQYLNPPQSFLPQAVLEALRSPKENP